MSKKKVIFICHGNICRSPMAQFIFLDEINKRGLQDNYEVYSMAVSYEEEGNDIDSRAKNQLIKNGIPFSFHPAHRIQLDEYRDADVIYVMDYSNLNILKRLFPFEDYTKVKLLNDPDEISDPWYTHNFDLAFKEIKEGARKILEEDL